MDIQDLGSNILKKIAAKTVLKAEVYLTHNQSTSVSVLNQKVEEAKTSDEYGLALRVIGKDKMGFAYTSDLSDEGIASCLTRSLENHDHNAPDKFWDIATPAHYHSVEELKIYDPALEKLSLKDKLDIAMRLEKAAHGFDPRVTRTEHCGYADGVSQTFLGNSEHLAMLYRSSSCGGMADVIATDGKNMESGSGMQYAVDLRSMDPEAIGKEAAAQACSLLGALSPETAKMDIVFSPDVGISFLAVLEDLFLSSMVQKGKSLLVGKLGQSIASSPVTLIDNGLLPGHLGTAPCDGEGTPCQRTVLLEKGILQNYLYSLYTARKDGKQSTGNAQRGMFSLPDVGPTNLYFEPGTLTQKELFKPISKGIYITKVMGMHTADPISGDFSIGISGQTIVNGALATPIRGGAIAGNLLTLLHSIVALGNDIRFLPYGGNIGSPSIHIKDMSVSGS